MWKVIIVEDNDLVRETLCKSKIWDEINVKITGSFKNGQSACEFIKTEEVDLVLTDILMPLMTGIDLAQYIFHEELQMKVIFLSSYNEFEYARNAIRFGVSEYIVKPIEEEVLKKSVQAVLQELQEERWIKKQLESSRPVIRNQFFDSLLCGKVYKDNFEEDCKYLDIELKEGNYRSLLLEMDSCKDEKIEKREVMLYTLENLTKQELTKMNGRGIVFVYQNRQVVIFLQDEIKICLVYEILEEIRRQFSEKFRATVSVGIGPVKDIFNIGISYKKAEEALRQRFIEGGDKIFDIAYLDSRRNNNIEEVQEFNAFSEQKFCETIKYCSEDEVSLMLDRIEIELKRRESTYQSSVFWVSYLNSYLFNLWYDLVKDEKAAVNKYYQNVYALYDQKTFKDTFEVFKNQVLRLFEEQHKIRKKRQNRIINQVIEYIELHYQDMDLNLNRLAEEVFLSSSYLSALFKKGTGQTISDYISNIRISHAKEMLIKTDYKISEISEYVGYINQFYFSSCFKKSVGVSPQEFRNSVVKKNE